MTNHRKEAEKWFSTDMPVKITQLVEGESDRGAILILSAYLEELLGELVRAACISDVSADTLLAFRRPAGDFDSRISLCAAFGLIHKTEEAGLEAVRRIRNRAAHFDRKGHGFDVLFSSDQTIDQVADLAKAMNFGLTSREGEAVKGIFIVAARLLATKIMIRAIEVERPTPPRTVKEIANELRSKMKGTPAGERARQFEELIRKGDIEAASSYFKELAARLRSHLEAQKPKYEGRKGAS